MYSYHESAIHHYHSILVFTISRQHANNLFHCSKYGAQMKLDAKNRLSGEKTLVSLKTSVGKGLDASSQSFM